MKRLALSMRATLVASVALALGATASGCEDRDEVWSAAIPTPTAFGLDGAVALADLPAERLLFLTPRGDMELDLHSEPIGPGYAKAAPTPDGERLLVLTHGQVPRRSSEEPAPMLRVFGGGESTPVGLLTSYELTDPLSGLAVDPESEFAVVHASSSDTGAFVQNPNELLVVELARPGAGDNPYPLSVRSFGGVPEAMTFTPTLSLPGGPRRLLVVRTDRDVAIVDLAHLELPEISVKLTGSTELVTPAGIAVSDGDPDPSTDGDARLAIRLQNDPNVIIVELQAVPEAEVATTPQSFVARPNVVYVGGAPSDVAFVQTDGGLRLAALVPGTQALTLVDPVTGVSSEVDVGASFDRLSLVTDIVGATDQGSDVALLWSTAYPLVAFVALGSTVGRPYKAVEHLQLGSPVASVLTVPPPNEHLRILTASSATDLVVLDLLERTASPIHASEWNTGVTIAPDGLRAWIHAGSSSLAQLDLESLHPRNLSLSYPINSVFDVRRPEGGRALLAVHAVGATAVTVLDALNPTLTTAREYPGLLLGELR